MHINENYSHRSKAACKQRVDISGTEMVDGLAKYNPHLNLTLWGIIIRSLGSWPCTESKSATHFFFYFDANCWGK